MATDGQIRDSRVCAEANRRNASRSTGPRTAEGKRRASRNSLRHGLQAETLTELDDADGCGVLLDSLVGELLPVGAVEQWLVVSIALGMIRVDRARRLEASHITAALHPPVTRGRFNDFMDRVEVLDPGKPAPLSSAAVEELADGLARYERATELRVYRALALLRALQGGRFQSTPPPGSFGNSG